MLKITTQIPYKKFGVIKVEWDGDSNDLEGLIKGINHSKKLIDEHSKVEESTFTKTSTAKPAGTLASPKQKDFIKKNNIVVPNMDALTMQEATGLISEHIANNPRN